MRAGDVLVVWKLDRLGCSLKNLIDVVTELDTLGIGFRSVTESIDTTTSGGKLIFHIFGALAEFERNLIVRERRQVSWLLALGVDMVVIRVSRHSETRRNSPRQSPCITTRRIVSPTSAQHFGSREHTLPLYCSLQSRPQYQWKLTRTRPGDLRKRPFMRQQRLN
jgi:hypothetical protein